MPVTEKDRFWCKIKKIIDLYTLAINMA